jgi:squalene-hopene/tetraprenyl-beta-curcumene cyclase
MGVGGSEDSYGQGAATLWSSSGEKQLLEEGIMMKRGLPCYLVVTFLAPAVIAREPEAFPKPSANSAKEPLAKTMSLDKAAAFLDGAALAWTRENKCGSCHTTFPYLMARGALGDTKAPALLKMRAFFEKRIANWDSGVEADKLPEGSEGVTEVVATAATLAFDDAQSSGKLHPLTRKALDRLWTLQKADGAWDWNKHELPPLEYDEYYGAVYAALGVGFAPDGYARSDAAKDGLAKLRQYFRDNRPPNLHHKTWLLFASLRLDGLTTPVEREQTIKDLLARQRDDGGWNLPSLGDWKRLDGTANDKDAASDGYATGLVVYVLRQAGMPADKEPIKRGLTWLKANQRESGRWFTRSVNADRAHYLTNAGTALAVLALVGTKK